MEDGPGATEALWDVVVNDEEQYSLWPAGRELPPGWKRDGVTGRRDDCLRHVKTVWIDMRPRSLRLRMAAPAGGSDGPAVTG